jgi:hypothetical protein
LYQMGNVASRTKIKSPGIIIPLSYITLPPLIPEN